MEQMDLSQRIINNWGINSVSLASQIRGEIDRAVSDKGEEQVKETVDMLVLYYPQYPLAYLKKALSNVIARPDSIRSEMDRFDGEEPLEAIDQWLIDNEFANDEEMEVMALPKMPSFPGWQEPLSDKEWKVFCTFSEDAWFWRSNPQYKENTFISVYRKAKSLGVSMHDICKEEKLVYRLLFRAKLFEEEGEE